MRTLIALLLLGPTPTPSPPPDASPTLRGLVNTNPNQQLWGKYFVSGLTVDGGVSMAGSQSSSNIPMMSTQDVRLYVDPVLGSDANVCTATGAAACLTLQGAIDKLPKGVRHSETVHATCGTYTCGFVSGFVGILGTSLDSGVTIEGELATATWDGGAGSTMSGTALAGLAGGPVGISATFGSLVTSNLYDVNALQGHYIVITGGYGNGLIRPISSNDAGVITVVGTWNIDAGSTYVIQDPCSFVSAPAPTCALPSTGAATAATTTTWGFYFTNNEMNQGTQVMELRNWGFTNDSGFLGNFIGVSDNSTYDFDQVMTPAWQQTQGVNIHLCQSGQCTARLLLRNGVQMADRAGGVGELVRIAGGSPTFTMLNGYAHSTQAVASLMLTFAGSPVFTIQSSEVNGLGNAGGIGVPNGYGTVSSNRFDCIVGGSATNVGIVLGSQSRQIAISTAKPLPQNNVSMSITTNDIGTHCGYGMSVSGFGARAYVNGTTGNGTTACIDSSWGGQVLQNASNSCTGTPYDYELDNGTWFGRLSALPSAKCTIEDGGRSEYGSKVCNF